MRGIPAACRLCANTQIEHLGEIPDSDLFAGRVLARPISGGSLWRCSSCGSMFRHPVLQELTYHEMYVAGAADQWSAGGARLDLQLIRCHISERAGSKRVLDLGCGTGEFLRTLPMEVRKFGIEPSEAAALAAGRAGITIVARTIEELEGDERFDVITIIDVIEHLIDPMRMLNLAVRHLVPGGCLIIGTGNPCHRLWRSLFRARFWYSCFPEHLTFPSISAFQFWCDRNGLAAPQSVRIRYRRLPAWLSSLHLALMITFLISPSFFNAIARTASKIRTKGSSRRRFFTPGAPGVFVDHQVVSIVRGPGHSSR